MCHVKGGYRRLLFVSGLQHQLKGLQVWLIVFPYVSWMLYGVNRLENANEGVSFARADLEIITRADCHENIPVGQSDDHLNVHAIEACTIQCSESLLESCVHKCKTKTFVWRINGSV